MLYCLRTGGDRMKQSATYPEGFAKFIVKCFSDYAAGTVYVKFLNQLIAIIMQ